MLIWNASVESFLRKTDMIVEFLNSWRNRKNERSDQYMPSLVENLCQLNVYKWIAIHIKSRKILDLLLD